MISGNPELKDVHDLLLIYHVNTILILMYTLAPEGYDLSSRPTNGSVTVFDFNTELPFEQALEVRSYNR